MNPHLPKKILRNLMPYENDFFFPDLLFDPIQWKCHAIAHVVSCKIHYFYFNFICVCAKKDLKIKAEKENQGASYLEIWHALKLYSICKCLRRENEDERENR